MTPNENPTVIILPYSCTAPRGAVSRLLKSIAISYQDKKKVYLYCHFSIYVDSSLSNSILMLYKVCCHLFVLYAYTCTSSSFCTTDYSVSFLLNFDSVSQRAIGEGGEGVNASIAALI